MTASTAINLDASEQAARIDRMVQETHKLVAEQGKLLAEQGKLLTEQHKLAAEADKLRRDHGFAPITVSIALISSAATSVAAVFALLKSLGVL